MLKIFKESAEKSNEFGALLTDLPKAFDCIDYKVLIAKLFCHVVSSLSLNLSNRTQYDKIKTSYSYRRIMEYAVPKNPLLGLLLFNIDLLDLCFECDDSRVVSVFT